jgi:hypothetical protein
VGDNPNPGYHSSKYYRNHPEARQPIGYNQTPTTKPEERSVLVVWLLRLVGVGIAIAGFGIMTASFWLGIFIVWAGLIAVACEGASDPILTGGPIQIQIVVIGIVCAIFGWFTISFPLTREASVSQSYAIRHGEYRAGTKIGNIEWDNHLAELHAVFTNPTNDTFSDVDLSLYPDFPTHKAEILNGLLSCDLKPIPGGMTFGGATNVKGGMTTVTGKLIGEGQLDMHDNQGNVYTTVLTQAGYRLLCDKVPPRFSVQMVFALGEVANQFRLQDPKPEARMSMAIGEIRGAQSLLELLGPRPYPLTLKVQGTYRQRWKPFSITSEVKVEDGN